MNKAKDVDELIQKLAETLDIGEMVRYDLGNLTYGEPNRLLVSLPRRLLSCLRPPRIRSWQINR